MSDLSKIKLNGTEYNIKDAVARSSISNIESSIENLDPFEIPIEQSQEDEFIYTTNVNASDIIANANNCILVLTENSDGIETISAIKIDLSSVVEEPEGNSMAQLMSSTYFDIFGYVGSFTVIASSSNNNVYIQRHTEEIPEFGTDVANLGIANPGNSRYAAREDHVHNLPTAAQIGALPSNTVIPSNLSQLNNDMGFVNSSAFTNFVDSTTVSNIISSSNDVPLILTANCNFGTSLLAGEDTTLSVTNVSATVQDIAQAVAANRPVIMVLRDGSMKINLQCTAYDGITYYFTNSYDPFKFTVSYNKSFNITVKAVNDSDITDSTYDAFSYLITYNKNAFASTTSVTNQINEALSNITSFDTAVVQSLPASGNENTIYFTPNNHGANDAYDEYMYISSNWEHIGSTAVDLSNYVQTSCLAYVAFSGDYANLNNTPVIPSNVSDLTNDSGFVTETNLPTIVNTLTSNFITLNDVPTELPAVSSSNNNQILTVVNGAWAAQAPAQQFSGDYNDLTNKPTIPNAVTVNQTLTSGIKIAEINGVSIYAPSYSNGDSIAY